MNWSASRTRTLILLVIIALVISTGCTMPQGTANTTSAGPGKGAGQATDSPSPVTPGADQTTRVNDPLSPPADRSTLNVLRRESFTINGTVMDPGITSVQAWLLNGTISMTSVPVMRDGTFRITLDAQETAALPRDFTSVLVVQYPTVPGGFGVIRSSIGTVIDAGNGSATPFLDHLKDAGTYPTTQENYLEQGVRAAGNNDTVYFLNSVDAWITIVPAGQAPPGSLVIKGTTSLPAGTPLSISITTASPHPTPYNYDFSHETANGIAVVTTGTGGTNTYAGTVNTSRLNTGRYIIDVRSTNESWQADATGTVDMTATLPASPAEGNYINWSALALPPLKVNASITPVMLAGGWKIVPQGTQTQNNEVPYGSIIDCASDGICRAFDGQGVQFLAVYDSNEEHQMEVPNGAAVGSGTDRNVTFIRLGENVVLTKIDEYPGLP